jgi:hypothetical protein
MYFLTWTIIIGLVLLGIKVYYLAADYLKRNGVDEDKNRKAISRHLANTPAARRAKQIETLYRAREAFLIPGVIQRRDSPGTDEDDR